ncbi:divalent metal cation transporter [Nostocaceae cyanobacterium CENA369]|uniref:Divalent metal cation transporter n=1 Tax=Dendronalium phyllosphericum CENA369 TaxID=1725256 RepID=A0A8J7LGG5_9NOST|nr:divalent metal cation transporter [Dendronalium phyllosphericum]MBH8574879.1 divalent metal cation transporter [Dendronalium phyllosphericum CENA369]
MNKILEIALGIITSIGGFLDVGAIATSAEAGSEFGFQLLWAIVLGTICVIFLVEMSGRLAAVSKHTLADAVRERFGFNFYVIPLLAEIVVDFLVLGAEIGGVCIALQLVTGISFQWFALPIAFVIWLLGLFVVCCVFRHCLFWCSVRS